jgi:hypothetical protein
MLANFDEKRVGSASTRFTVSSREMKKIPVAGWRKTGASRRSAA